MANSSPPPLSPPPPPAAAAAGTGAWGSYDSKRAFVVNVVTTVVALICVSLLAFAVYAGLRCCRRRSKTPRQHEEAAR
jgi:hypothetical protein